MSRHVVIDGRELAGRPTGVGRYLLALLAEWARDPGDRRYTVIVPGAVPAALAALAPAITVDPLPASATGTWYEQTTLAGRVRDLAPDVFFAPAYTAPLRLPCPLVVTIHDVSFFALPQEFRWREGLRRRWLTRAAARRAAVVTTVSAFSADEIARYTRVDRAAIVVAPNGAPPAGPMPGTRPPTVLYAGTLLGRRHVDALIDAFAAIRAEVPEARLELIGHDRAAPPVDPAARIALSPAAGAIRWRPWVDETALAEAYDAARVFAFPSTYEGFALTPLEAIAHGAAAVLADTPVAREVYGDGAVYAPPTPGGLAAAIAPLLTDDAAWRTALERGRARLPRFAWADTAARVREALDRA
jgi:glycosyltransferase involved in cell wall biosynthesis